VSYERVPLNFHVKITLEIQLRSAQINLMNQFHVHNLELKGLFSSLAEGTICDKNRPIDSLDTIDGILRSLLSIEDMRSAGSFFTGDELSTELAARFIRPIDLHSVVLDPTCGAGNLLIACSRKLPIDNSSLERTIGTWSKVLHGYDLYSSFVDATKYRLIIEAANRGAKIDSTLENLSDLLSNIIVKDAMTISSDSIKAVTHCVMNPPFSMWPSPKTQIWKKGKVNAAAIISLHVTNLLPTLSEVSAILPEVLRSGSRYADWRTQISTGLVGNIELMGKFNPKTNIDVFFMFGVIEESSIAIKWQELSSSEVSVVGQYFKVCIGSVVPHRDAKTGNEYTYLTAKNTPKWEVLSEFPDTRKFSGTVYEPPFLVVRRTSSPSDNIRAKASVILGKHPIAVENHLIVIKPLDNKASTCERLMQTLKNEESTSYLNSNIRCRHLTVGSVKTIPFKPQF
jgi:hypothetical protein